MQAAALEDASCKTVFTVRNATRRWDIYEHSALTTVGPNHGGHAPIAFVVEDFPASNISGPSTYNAHILRSLVALGFPVHVMVTGPRLGRLFGTPCRVEAESVSTLQGFKIGDAGLPKTVAAAVRMSEATVGLNVSPRRKGKGVVRLGRYITPRQSLAIAEWVRLKGAACVLIDTIFRSPVLDCLPPSVPSILIAHDVFSERTASFHRNCVPVEPAISPSEEARILRRFGGIVAISTRDGDAFGRLAPGASTAVVPPLISGPVASRTSSQAHSRQLFYLGSQTPHNVDGLDWFLDEVWPNVRAQVPDGLLSVVGTVRAAHPIADGVVSHGHVEKPETIAGACRFAINPIRMGSGLKMKMIDYFAVALPCVSTSEGASGLPHSERPPFLVADTPEAFAAASVTLLREHGLVERLAGYAADYAGLFAPDAAVSAMGSLLAQLDVVPVR
jgi:hypothetical protein